MCMKLRYSFERSRTKLTCNSSFRSSFFCCRATSLCSYSPGGSKLAAVLKPTTLHAIRKSVFKAAAHMSPSIRLTGRLIVLLRHVYTAFPVALVPRKAWLELGLPPYLWSQCFEQADNIHGATGMRKSFTVKFCLIHNITGITCCCLSHDWAEEMILQSAFWLHDARCNVPQSKIWFQRLGIKTSSPSIWCASLQVVPWDLGGWVCNTEARASRNVDRYQMLIVLWY